MQLTWENVLLLLTLASLAVSIFYNIRNARRCETKDQRDEGRVELEDAKAEAKEAEEVSRQLAQLNTEMQKQSVVIANVSSGVIDIRADFRSQGVTIQGLTERVTRVEESAKQAHKRIDRIDPHARAE